MPLFVQKTLKWVFRLLWFGVAKWAFDNFAWDAVVQALEMRLGIREADVITSVLSLIIPFGIAVAATAGAVWLGRKQQEAASAVPTAPHPAAPELITPSPLQEAQLSFRPYVTQAILIVLIIGGIFYALYHRSNVAYELGTKNADIRVIDIRLQPPQSETDTLAVHIVMQNKGGADAAYFAHSNNEFIKANGLLPDFVLDGQFEQIKKNLRQAANGAVFARDEKSYFSYVAPTELADKANYAKILDGSALLYILYMMRYRDKDIPTNKFIWTEKCWFILPTTAIAICPKHNGSNYVE
ncbi:MAG TPA: hypothetical protein VK430_09980 [Xanthobacteraceae bacterium]|nr:hypothetical protein [Xanthobacteraceae bacterium]